MAWDVGDSAVCQHVPCAKSGVGRTNFFPLVTCPPGLETGVFGMILWKGVDRRWGEGGIAHIGRDLVLLEIAQASSCSLTATLTPSNATLPTLAANSQLFDPDLCSELSCNSRNKVCQTWQRTQLHLRISFMTGVGSVFCVTYFSGLKVFSWFIVFANLVWERTIW